MATIRLTLILDDRKKMWLEQIVLDKDKDGAFKFLKEYIYNKVNAQEKGHCKPAF